MKTHRSLILGLLSVALFAWGAGTNLGQAVSEGELLAQLVALNAKGSFDEAQSKVLAYMKEEPDAAELLYRFVQDLRETHRKYERVINIIDQTLPALEKTAAPVWVGRFEKLTGHRDYIRSLQKDREGRGLGRCEERLSACCAPEFRNIRGANESWHYQCDAGGCEEFLVEFQKSHPNLGHA